MDIRPYDVRRDQLEEYFDRTAVEAWASLTSDAPVSRIRATVRAGRERMRSLLLDYLPDDLTGQRVLDAGCGTGALAVEAAHRGAHVVAVDISPTLIRLAEERMVLEPGVGGVEFRVSDMRDAALGRFDWVVAMDSFIHYPAGDMVDLVAALAARASRGLAFTFAPSSAVLTMMHSIGRIFPRHSRAPDIVPISEGRLRRRLAEHPELGAFTAGRSERVKSGFYTSQTMELVRA
ncbi:MAG: magnesium protoporphyrin IX methyltransferase [Sandaracinaceae bacterium]